MKKRVITILLTGMMLCSMTGCSMVSSILENVKESNVEDQNDDEDEEDSDDNEDDDAKEDKHDESGKSDEDSKDDQKTDSKKADALSEDLSDFVVEIDGDIYQFPFQVQELLDNGWEINPKIDSTDMEIGKQNVGSVFLTRGDVDFPFTVENETDEKVSYKDAYVFYASSFLNDNNIAFGSNIKVGDSIETVKDAIDNSTNMKVLSSEEDTLSICSETYDNGIWKKGYTFEFRNNQIYEIAVQYMNSHYMDNAPYSGPEIKELSEEDIDAFFNHLENYQYNAKGEETKEQKDMTDEEIDDFFENLGLPDTVE